MRLMVVLAALIAPRLAFAQGAPSPDSDKAWTEVQQQAAEAESTQDCALACRALESLARATKHLCDIGPEHCEEARAKLRQATEKVRAACPDCAASAGQPPQMTAQPTVSSRGENVAAESASRKGGGCAGCTTSGSSGDLAVPALAALGILAMRRKRRR